MTTPPALSGGPGPDIADGIRSDPRVEPPIEQPRGPAPTAVRALGIPTDKPLTEGYAEVEYLRERAYSIDWESVAPAPREMSRGALSPEERLLIEGLYELRILTTGQIERGFLGSIRERHVRRRLSRLRDMGMVQRGSIYCAGRRGSRMSIYALARNGFLLLCADPDHPASGKWNRSPRRGAQHVAHDLCRNEWLFAFRSLAPRQLVGYRGTGTGRIKSEKFSSIVPDLTLELQLERSDGPRIGVDLLIEVEWRNNREAVRGKAIAYDHLLNHWWREHPRYRALGRPPNVCFVVPDLQRAHRYIANLDEALQEHVVIPPHTQTRRENELGIVPTMKRIYFGRRRVFVAVAADVHQRTLRAWQVPDKPPDERLREAGDEDDEHQGARPIPRRVVLLPSRDLVDPAV